MGPIRRSIEEYITENWWDFFLAPPVGCIVGQYYSSYFAGILAGIGITIVLLVFGKKVNVRPQQDEIAELLIIGVGLGLLLLPSALLSPTQRNIDTIIERLSVLLLAIYFVVTIFRVRDWIKGRISLLKQVADKTNKIDVHCNEKINPLLDLLYKTVNNIDGFQQSMLTRLFAAHALYTDKGYMEEILHTIGGKRTPIKYAMAKMVSVTLSRVFISKGRFVLKSQSYGEFAKAFGDCIGTCSQVALTCKFAPYTWFTRIRFDTAAISGCWGDLDVDLNGLSEQELTKLTDNNKANNRYPQHFISHLGVKAPVRIFLLGALEWPKLIAKRDAYQKFMRPCKNIKNMKSYFVQTEIFKRVLDSQDTPLYTHNWLKNQRDRLHEIDINLFDQGACMSWSNDKTIEFIFDEDELSAYIALIDFIQQERSTTDAIDLGIYTWQNLEDTWTNLK